MKKLAIITTATTIATISIMGAAYAAPKTKPAPAKLPADYQAVYCYPTGTYWAKQIASYPDYYKANDASLKASYGVGTIYCAN